MSENIKSIFKDIPSASDLFEKIEIKNNLNKVAQNGDYKLRVEIGLLYSDIADGICELVKKHFSNLGYVVKTEYSQMASREGKIDGFELSWESAGISNKNECS